MLFLSNSKISDLIFCIKLILVLLILLCIPNVILSQTIWTKYESNPVLDADPGLPMVMYENGIYKMYSKSL